MTPRAEAWIRQAHNDLDAARCMAAEAFHAQALATAEAVLRIAAAELTR